MPVPDAVPAAFVAPHDRVLNPIEQAMLRERRRQLLASARGVVLDVGGGAGEHLRLYPPAVVRVDVVGVDPVLGGVVRRRARVAPLPVHVVPGTLTELGGTYDTVVLQLVACAVADLGPVLARLRELLDPSDGRLLFLEHLPLRAGPSVVTSLARPVWKQVASGCDLACDLPAELRRSGLAVTDIERFTMPTLTVPLRRCALGVARRQRYDGTRGAR